MKEEQDLINRMQTQKKRSLTQLWAILEATQTTIEGLDSELNQDLLTTLSSKDQGKVDMLNGNIRWLKTENKKAFSERTRLEPVHTPAIEKLN